MEQVKFQALLNELGIAQDQTPKGIKTEIEVFNEMWDEYNEAYQNYNAATDPQEKEVYLSELNEFEADLEQADEVITKKIHTWNTNKGLYAENMKKAIAARKKNAANKRAAKGEEVATIEAPAAEPEPALSETVVDAQGGIIDPQQNQAASFEATPQQNFDTPPPSQKEESGGGLGWWILGGAIAIITLGVGVKYLKNK